MALLSFKEAARIANKSQRTIERWCYEEQSLPYSKPSDGYGGNTPMVDEFDLLRRLGRNPVSPTDDDAERRQAPTHDADNGRHAPIIDVPARAQDVADQRGVEGMRLILQDRDERHAALLATMQEGFNAALADMDRRHTTQLDAIARRHTTELAAERERAVTAEQRAQAAAEEAAALREQAVREPPRRGLWARLRGKG